MPGLIKPTATNTAYDLPEHYIEIGDSVYQVLEGYVKPTAANTIYEVYRSYTPVNILYGVGDDTLVVPDGVDYFLSGRGADAGFGTGAGLPADTVVRRGTSTIFTAASGKTPGALGTSIGERKFTNSSGSDVTLNISVPAAGKGGPGTLYVIRNTGNPITYRYTPSGSRLSDLSWTPIPLVVRTGVTVGENDNTLYTVTNGGQIQRVNVSAGTATVFKDSGGTGWRGIAYHNNIVYAIRSNRQISRWNATTGTFTSSVTITDAPNIAGMTVDSDGIWVLSGGDLRSYSLTGTRNSSGDVSLGTLTRPVGVTRSATRIYVVTDTTPGKVLVWDTSGNRQSDEDITLVSRQGQVGGIAISPPGADGVSDGWVRVRTTLE